LRLVFPTIFTGTQRHSSSTSLGRGFSPVGFPLYYVDGDESDGKRGGRMSSPEEEAQELREMAEHGRSEAGLAPVSLTMAILAVFVAAVMVLSHRAHTEEIILQSRVGDQWAYYQAKNIRRQNNELFLDLLGISEFKDQKAAAALKQKYQDTIAKYGEQQLEIKAEAEKLTKEVELERRRADRYDLGESFLEVGLVITSITLLTRKRIFWGAGVFASLIGTAIALTGLMLH
jgi:hypothetical protein